MIELTDLAMPILRLCDPETAHGLTIAALKLGLGPIAMKDPDAQHGKLAGFELPNLVGLAAGFDKNAEVPTAMLRAGFGFVECGTVTPRPQAGNPRPRLFRLSEDAGVINRMGFNNAGLDAFAHQLQHPRAGIVGANIGANKDSADRIQDYVQGLERLWGSADYFTLNISSPNTPGLRALQTRSALEELLGEVAACRARLSKAFDPPLFVKVAPDLDDAEIEAVVETARRFGLNGIIVGNTTVSRPPTLRGHHRTEVGGLSGAPLAHLASTVLGRFATLTRGQMTLISAGGIASGAEAYARLRVGANAVQIYSALVYQGPKLVTEIKRDLLALARSDGFRAVADAIGKI